MYQSIISQKSWGKKEKKYCENPEELEKARKSVEDLGNAFSKHCGNTYLKEFNEVKNIIEKADWNSIIVVYSAWNIDFKLRQYLEIL